MWSGRRWGGEGCGGAAAASRCLPPPPLPYGGALPPPRVAGGGCAGSCPPDLRKSSILRRSDGRLTSSCRKSAMSLSDAVAGSGPRNAALPSGMRPAGAVARWSGDPVGPAVRSGPGWRVRGRLPGLHSWRPPCRGRPSRQPSWKALLSDTRLFARLSGIAAASACGAGWRCPPPGGGRDRGDGNGRRGICCPPTAAGRPVPEASLTLLFAIDTLMANSPTCRPSMASAVRAELRSMGPKCRRGYGGSLKVASLICTGAQAETLNPSHVKAPVSSIDRS